MLRRVVSAFRDSRSKTFLLVFLEKKALLRHRPQDRDLPKTPERQDGVLSLGPHGAGGDGNSVASLGAHDTIDWLYLSSVPYVLQGKQDRLFEERTKTFGSAIAACPSAHNPENNCFFQFFFEKELLALRTPVETGTIGISYRRIRPGRCLRSRRTSRR